VQYFEVIYEKVEGIYKIIIIIIIIIIISVKVDGSKSFFFAQLQHNLLQHYLCKSNLNLEICFFIMYIELKKNLHGD
jgi:hypothetical protein